MERTMELRKRNLEMPSNYVVVSNEEMEYVDGGNARVDVRNKIYLNKAVCGNVGFDLAWTKRVKGMTSMEIAKELYAHALMYFRASILPSWVRNRIQSRAGIADITDGGDTWARRQAYNTMWAIY